MPGLNVVLAIIAVVLFVVAAVADYPRNPPAPGWGHSLAWLASAFFAASFVVH